MGDCNMVDEQVKLVVASLLPAPSFVCTCTRKRDFIVSSATLRQSEDNIPFLAWDKEHWSLVAQVHNDAVPQRQHGQIDDSDSAQESQPLQDEVKAMAAKAIWIEAEQRAAQHLKEQHKLTVDALAERQEADHQAELQQQQAATAEQQSAQASSSQQVCVDPIVLCGPCVVARIIQFESQLDLEYMLFICSPALESNYDSSVTSKSISFTHIALVKMFNMISN